MIRHGLILVPTDFSDLATEALRRAVRIAKHFPARVHLVHVFSPPVATLWGMEMDLAPPPLEWEKELRAAAQRRLEEAAQSVQDDAVEITTELIESAGSAAAEICDTAKRHGADLIVIGRHGQKGALDRWILGSTAERVVREAPCSVLVAMPHGLFGQEHTDAQSER